MNRVKINEHNCKGCRLCVDACPKQCLHIGSKINSIGYQYAIFKSESCTACGICYYTCPEFGTITVYKEENNNSEDTNE